MFTFRNLTLVFFLLLLILNLFSIFTVYPISGLVREHAVFLYPLLVFTYLGVSVAMAFLPCSGFHHPVLCRGNTIENQVSLTFDDGPHPEKTPGILKVLAKYNVQAAFFCTGSNIVRNKELVMQIHRAGHILGNHSYSHSVWFDLFPVKKMSSEILKTGKIIEEIAGKSPLLFRPPFGVINPMVSRTINKLNIHAVCWDIRTYDTLRSSPEAIITRILRRLKPGSIILLHDHTAFSEKHLEELLIVIRKAGFSIVPLDQLLKVKAYESLGDT